MNCFSVEMAFDAHKWSLFYLHHSPRPVPLAVYQIDNFNLYNFLSRSLHLVIIWMSHVHIDNGELFLRIRTMSSIELSCRRPNFASGGEMQTSDANAAELVFR